MLFEVALDFLLARLLTGFLAHLLLNLRRERVELHPQQEVGNGVTGAGQEFLEIGFLGELLGLDLVELLLDFGVRNFDAAFFGLLDHPVGGDQISEDLLLERGVLLFALALKRGCRRLGLTLGGLWRCRFKVSDAVFVGGRVRNDRLGRGLAGRRGSGAGAGGHAHPMVERFRSDRRAVDADHSVARDAAAAARGEGHPCKQNGAQRRNLTR